MSDAQTTFVAACLAGDALAHDIDDWVGRWHDGEGDSVSLDEFLGFRADEGQLWAERPESLGLILHARRHRTTVNDLAKHQSSYALAARSESDEHVQGVFKWLEARGRISTAQ